MNARWESMRQCWLVVKHIRKLGAKLKDSTESGVCVSVLCLLHAQMLMSNKKDNE